MGHEFDKRLLELSARDSRDNIPLATTVIIIITLGVFGNAVAFIFYGFKERGTTVTNFLIGVLSFNDLIVNLVFYDETFFHFKPFKFTNTTGCKMLYGINNWVLLNSVSLMLVIAIERHRKICHPFSWQLTHVRAQWTTICVTLSTLVICSKEAIFAEIVPEHIKMNDNSTVIGYICVHSHDKHLKPFIKGSNFLTMLLYLSAFASIITIYSLIIRRIYRINKASSANKNSILSKHEVIEMKESTNSSGNATASTSDSNMVGSTQGSNEIGGSDIDAEQEQLKSVNGAGNASGTEDIKVVESSGSSDSKEEHHRQTKIVAKQRNNPQNKLAAVERKLTKMIIIVAIASILSFVPYFLVILLVPSHYSTENQLSNMKKKVFRESYKFNGVLNPYIMCIFNANFRQFIKGILCKCCSKK